MSTKRIRHDQAHWQQLVKRQALSGLSAAQFCREYQVAYASFMSWRKRLQDISTPPMLEPEKTFVELITPAPIPEISHKGTEPESHLRVELTLGAGIELRITRTAG